MPLALIIALAVIVLALAGAGAALLALRNRRARIRAADAAVRARLTPRSGPADAHECPFCGLVADAFEPFGSRANARCPQCGSLERHRLAWLYLLNETDLFSAGAPRRVLHLAPEVPSWRRLSQVEGIEFVSPDDPASDVGPLDPAALPFADGSFDVILAGHALEGIGDPAPAIAELARVLRAGGWALVQDPGQGSDAERRAQALARAGLEVTSDRYPRRIGAACARRFALTLSEEIHFARRAGPAGSLARLWVGARDVAEAKAVPGARPVFRGRVENVRDGLVSGWVWRLDVPEHRVHVRMIVNGKGVTGGIAERERRSLADAGIGDGRHAFRIALPQSVATAGPHRLRVEPEGSLGLPPAANFSATAERKGQTWGKSEFSVEGFVVGRVESVRGGVVCGWAWSPEAPAWRLGIQVFVDGVQVGSCRAELPRRSLADGGVGDGRHGFRCRLPESLAGPGDHCLRVEARGFALPAAASFVVEDPPERDERAVEIATDGLIQGRVEAVRDGVVTGWAWNPDAPEWRVRVRALVDGMPAGSALADLPRPSLVAAGIGDGRHAFRLALPPALAAPGRHVLRVEGDGGVPIPASASFERAAQAGEETTFTLEDPVFGRIERVADGVVSGWVCRPTDPGWRADVRVIVDGATVVSAVADLDHPDLARAGIGDGRYAFSVPLPDDLPAAPTHNLRVLANGGVPLLASSSFHSIAHQPRSRWADVEFRVEDAVIGRIEQASDGVVSGWAYRPGAPGWRVWVRLTVDGEEVAAGPADRARTSLAGAGIGDGRHAFQFELPQLLPQTGRHRVRAEAEGVTLPVTVSFEKQRPQAAPWVQARFSVDGGVARGDRPPVIGRVESVRDGVVSGWAYSPSAPDWPVWVRAVLDGEDVAGSAADLDHPGLAAVGVAGGFAIALPDHDPGEHRLRIEAADGITLPPAPGALADGERSYTIEVSPARYR